MKKRVWALAMACVLGCAAMVGCGNSQKQTENSVNTENAVPVDQTSGEKHGQDATFATLVPEEETDYIDGIKDTIEEKIDQKKEKTVNGTYVDLLGLSDHSDEYIENVDGGVAAVLQEAADPDTSAFCRRISLNNGEFQLNEIVQHPRITQYYGNYSIVDDKLHFNYQIWEIDDGMSGSADDTPSGDIVQERLLEKLKNLNMTKGYYRLCYPKMYGIDRYVDYGMYPHFFYRDYYNTEIFPAELEQHEDLICIATYGFELNGGYHAGSDFEIVYSPFDVLFDDPISCYYTQEWDNERLNKMAVLWKRQYSLDSISENEKTEFKFSDGKWEWYNSEGDLINNGSYQESKAYPGLIMMTITEDSLKAPAEGERKSGEWRIYSACSPLLFYIAEDGEIYYPGFVRVE